MSRQNPFHQASTIPALNNNPINGVMLQGFEWYLPSSGKHWVNLKKEATNFKKMGITSIWLPPVSKGSSGIYDVGYGIYDSWDLGEFNQKNTTRTKYGTKKELMALINQFNSVKIHVYGDMVYNHRVGEDFKELIKVVEVDGNNRLSDISPKKTILAGTGFNYSSRGGKYSKFRWKWYHFVGVDWDYRSGTKKVYRILGKDKYWSMNVDKELGNYDYLLGSDIDLNHPQVQNDLQAWTSWLIATLQLKGLRIDALKHIDLLFIKSLVANIKSVNPSFFVVGEYWKNNAVLLNEKIENMDRMLSLFDVPLHNNLYEASLKKSDYDLRKIFIGSLVQLNPTSSVTFVDNHDTQPGQALVSFVEPWFRVHSYTLVLLRQSGYPCVFYPDIFGFSPSSPFSYAGIPKILKVLLRLRKQHNFGDQLDYFDHPNTIGWVRQGLGTSHRSKKTGFAVVLSNGDDGWKFMDVGSFRKGEQWCDVLTRCKVNVTISKNGVTKFKVQSKRAAVYIKFGSLKDH